MRNTAAWGFTCMHTANTKPYLVTLSGATNLSPYITTCIVLPLAAWELF